MPQSDNTQPHNAPAASREGIRRRAFVGAAVLTLLLLALVARLAYVQIGETERFQRLAQQQKTIRRSLSARRGNIYDRTGRLLATSVRRWSIFADPAVIDDPGHTAAVLGHNLDLNPRQLFQKMQGDRRFEWIKRQIPDDLAERLKKYDLHGIHFRKEYHRLYPPTRLSAHVIGFTDIDGRGISGAELQFDRILRSTPGEQHVLRDAMGRVILRPDSQPLVNPENGYDIQLTLDSYIQHVARKALTKQVEKHVPDAAWALVMDVRTGAVLAMVNHPEFNPNKPAETHPAARRNRTITDSYEFGSVMKPITVAAALEADLIEPDTTIPCHDGAWRIGSRVVHDVHGHEELSVSGVVVHSSNIGAAQIGLKLGPRKFYRGLKRFGFGQPSEINLPGVTSGILRPPERWNKHSCISIAFGQEISSTPLAVARAFATIANDGLLLRTHVLNKVIDHETGRTVWRPEKKCVVRRAVSKRTADQVMNMLRSVVTDGTGRRVQLDEYAVAGKTGTASIPRRDGGGYSNRYLGSFIGIAPADNPRLVALVSLKNPTRNGYYGGIVAGPACRTILRKTLQYLNVPKRTDTTAVAEAQ